MCVVNTGGLWRTRNGINVFIKQNIRLNLRQNIIVADATVLNYNLYNIRETVKMSVVF